MSNRKRWTVADAAELYNIAGWGRGYFGVNSRGNVTAHPDPGHSETAGSTSAAGKTGIDLLHLVEDALGHGLSLPLLIRFSDILAHRLRHVRRCFADAIAAHRYQGEYLGVYPLKVNQQRQVVEEIVRFGAEQQMGLEVGSKSELHAALAALETPGAVIVCNGFKDAAYVRLALLGQKLGRRIFLVVEKPAELPLILRISRETGIPPLLGFRIRLVATGSGRWEDSGGDGSKFGLASWELLAAVKTLRGAGMLDCLQLIHTHLGSQINNIRHVKEAVRETGRYYVELCRLGCAPRYVDVGGGLGVDYDGTRSTFGFSVNYNEQEYAHEVVGTLGEICGQEGLPHPGIICEAGRALTAYHAMLVLNVLGTTSLDGPAVEGAPDLPKLEEAEGPETPNLANKLSRLLAGLNARTLSAYWAEAQLLREESNQRFELGYLPLPERSRIDRLFWAIARRVERLGSMRQQVPGELEELEALLADKYFCNFSVFQSLPDAWAIQQEFPVVPLHRLDERPTRMGTVQDITCDSDGRLLHYTGRMERGDCLPLHPLRPGEPYYLGVFLTGAYQEILGDLHNLFGDATAVHVAFDGGAGGAGGRNWHTEQVIPGESVSRVLEYVQFGRDLLLDRIDRRVRASVAAGGMTRGEGKAFRDLYVAGLDGPTYLEAGDENAARENTARKNSAREKTAREKTAREKTARPARGGRAEAG